MYHLPDVLIDYIFSFDSNYYHKTIFNAVIRELDYWYSRRCTQLFISNKYDIYKIYCQFYIGGKKSMLTLSQYILSISKQCCKTVYVPSIKYKLQFPHNTTIFHITPKKEGVRGGTKSLPPLENFQIF
jgi:hypothetical protein